MSLDSITEQIAHFVGAFELISEQARLRDQYEEFVALRRKAELEDLEDPTRIQIKANLQLDPGEYEASGYSFAAAQVSMPPAPALPGSTGDAPVFLSSPVSPEFNFPETEAIGAPSLSVQLNAVQLLPEIELEIIGSAVTYTFQTLNLSDNDTIGEGDFRDVEVLMEQGEAMLNTAMSMHALSELPINISDYQTDEVIETLIEQMLSPQNAEVEGATVHQFHGEDAMGVIVNGEYLDEMPVWSELLPEHHQPDDDTEDDTPDPMPAEWDQSEDPDFEDGHSMVTGANLAINEVAVNVGWVDAPNFIVGGKAVNLTVVSQVAVVSDNDEGDSGAQSDTNVIQSSLIDVKASEAPWVQDNVAEPGQDTIVAIDWISGDLIVSNFIEQVIDATDIDQIHTDITASSTAYTMGENVLVNVTDILQLGSYYDVIIVGGDMISVDIVSQTIVLLDDDVMSGVVPSDTDDNLVMNEVSLTTNGEDTHQELSENLADTVSLQKVDTDALEDALLNDPAFAGAELVRVLKIDGDLLQVNVIEQITMLQDQDDIYVNGSKGAEASALGGGNAILNSASINKMGVDSVVMAQEGEYSDLLLHQASLIDGPEDDNGELVNEAVALLMEEVDAPGNSENAPGQTKLTPSESASIDDGMQSMIA
ncbi:type I secretion protein [Ruegeria lacuscaerulensis]|uniref:type I secretion protein n=1 Tax=Ruegeria lacuscaerulensis TaxID=55218 RepID=UPI00148161FC|nr:type I secretion protein [Ruegeria lacuscaerulensis]